jgi:hypothetical protein
MIFSFSLAQLPLSEFQQSNPVHWLEVRRQLEELLEMLSSSNYRVGF